MSKAPGVGKHWAHSVCAQVHVSPSEGSSVSPGSTGRQWTELVSKGSGKSRFEGLSTHRVGG